MNREPVNVVPLSIRRHLGAGLVGVILLAGAAGGWAATTELAGAVIGAGTLMVDSYSKKAQHPTGGVVGELNVREGSRVKAEDVLLRLDETVTRANLLVILKSLDELAARQARLEAERDDQKRVDFPADLIARISDTDVARVLVGEHKLFELRGTARAGTKAQLNERIGQLREQIGGLEEQIAAKDCETRFVDQEFVGVRDLWRKNLVQITRVTTLERDAVRLHGERGALVASIAEARSPRPRCKSCRSIRISVPRWEGACRDSREDLGTGREAGSRRGSAQAHRYPRAAGRHRAAARAAHDRRRRHRRRADHADRPRSRLARR
ncbi:HlyD family secretion protein [Bradyrhizobium elkanii]|nr:HlyD family secretion protein [Bradyrhizobium elkanii]